MLVYATLETWEPAIVGQKIRKCSGQMNLAGHSCLGSNKLQSCVVFCAATSNREQAPGRMIEARLTQGGVLKKLSEVLEEFLDYGTVSSFDCSADGISLQAMDNAHVAVVSVMLRSQGFDYYRCDRPVSLGMNVDALATLLKCANDDDVVTMKAHASARHALQCIV